MEKCMITFRSVTPAQRAEQLLRRAGVRCELHRTPRYLAQQGCGYSLRLSCRDIMTSAAFLRQAGIHFRRAYTLRDDGTPEELRL